MRKATCIVVAMGHHFGHEPAKIRSDATSAIATALEGSEIETILAEINGKPEQCIDMAGVFRLVLEHEGIDRADQRTQERWLAIVQDELDQQLGKAG